jgi:hypothetical protein
MRDHDVTALTRRELEQARRELAASMALARPGSPARVPILAQIKAIDAELASRSGAQPDKLPGSLCPEPLRGLSRQVENTPLHSPSYAQLCPGVTISSPRGSPPQAGPGRGAWIALGWVEVGASVRRKRR